VSIRIIIFRVALTCTALVLCCAAGLAEAAPAAAPAEQPVAVAQAAPTAVPAARPPREAAKPEESAPVAERVTTLEKESVVMREDLGKARLDARADLEAAAKRQAEAIERLHKELVETQAKLEAERAAQARRNRHLWMAVGVVALGVLLSE